MISLENKVALITGAGRGIGRALALKLASAGAKIVVNDLDEAPAMEVVNVIHSSGGKAVPCVGSVTGDGFAERFIETGLTNFGGLDVIVNNAGYTLDNVIQKMTDQQFDAMMDVHVVAPFKILRAAAEPIRTFAKLEAQSGQEVFRKVVNISSIAGTGGNAGQSNYSAAKAAVIGLTKSLSKEWGRYKVCVNCVAFGNISTRLTLSFDDPGSKITIDGKTIQAGIPAAAMELVPTMIPMGRAGTPEEAANGVYLFCTPESNYISGQVVVVGGGFSL